MNITDCKLKIICFDILRDVQIDEISTSIEYCPDFQTTLASVDRWKNADYKVFVVCHQKDFHHLHQHILDGNIDKTYIFDGTVANIRNNNRRIIASTEDELKYFIKLGAGKHIHSIAVDTPIGENRSQIMALLSAVQRLLGSM
jgi:hypothetical protein